MQPHDSVEGAAVKTSNLGQSTFFWVCHSFEQSLSKDYYLYYFVTKEVVVVKQLHGNKKT